MRQTIDIEAFMHWVMIDQRAEQMLGRCAGPSFRSGATWVDEVCTLGASISGGMHFSGDVHPDAELGLLTLARLRSVDPVCYTLARHHAICGSRPDWMPGARATMIPVLHDKGRQKGKPRMILDRSGHVIGCEVQVGLAQAVIDKARGIYELWHAGLGWLCTELSESDLQRYRVTGPAAPRRPWESAETLAMTKAA